MVWNVVSVYTQIIIHEICEIHTSRKPNITELMLEVMTQFCILCHESVAELNVL